MKITRNKNAKELAGQTLTDLFKEAGDDPVLFLSSGGSALNILEGVDKNILGQNFTFGVLDERFSGDPKINNFLQLKNKLGDMIGANWIDSVPRENDTLKTLANRMESAWRKWRSANAKGKIVVTMGMGADGHTVGIMPSQQLNPRGLTVKPPRFNSRWVVGYDAGAASQYPLRLTAAFEFLRKEVDFAIIYISGGEKRPALERVLVNTGDLSETPARIFREMKNVEMFTDIL